MDENKKKALDAAVMQIEKDFGRGAVMRLGDTSAFGEVEVVPTLQNPETAYPYLHWLC